MPYTHEYITSSTLGSATKSITFSSISSSYTDLVLILNGKTTGNDDFLNLTFNSDTGSNYSLTRVYGNSTSVYAGHSSNATRIYVGYDAAPNTSPQWNSILNFMDYSNTTTYKVVLFRDNSPNGTSYLGTAFSAGSWRNTSAINTIKIEANTYNLDTGFTATLYGIKAA